MTYYCCYCHCKIVSFRGEFDLEKPCIYCGKTKYYWYDYYDKYLKENQPTKKKEVGKSGDK